MSHQLAAWPLAALLALSACSSGYRPIERGASAEPGRDRAAGKVATEAMPTAPTGPRPDPRIATWRGGALHASDLGRFMLRTMREESLGALSRLVSEQLLAHEVRRLGIAAPPGFLSLRREQLLRDAEIEAVRAYGAEATAEQWVRLRYRRTLDSWLRERLVEERQRWLLERVVRYRSLGTDRVRLSLIVVPDPARARELARRLAEGAEFEKVAREHSRHASRESGGQLPPLPKAALNPVVAARAFAMRPGEVSGVLEVEDEAGRRQYEILRVEEFLMARIGTWSELRQVVEDSLEAEPLRLPEWTAWMLQLEREHGVELRLDAL